MTRRVVEAPGVIRLRREGAGPRSEPARRVVQSIISANLPTRPARKPKNVAVGQSAMF